MEQERTEMKNKDNSEFSKLVAAFYSAEGSLVQLKESLKTHATNNGYPIEGLGLDESVSVAPEETVIESPAPAPAPAPEPDVVTQTEMFDNNASLPVPVSASTETFSETESESGSGSRSGSESDSGSELEDNSENLTSAIPEIPVNQTVSGLNNMPETNNTSANSFGGRNHYISSSTNKKAKTHRHHKRRNRHQTLRTSTK